MAVKVLTSTSGYGDASFVRGTYQSRFGRESNSVLIVHRAYKPVSEFQKVIISRCQYLENLKNLSDDWISGESVAPTDQVIDSVKQVLCDFSDWVENEHLPAPELIMGPIPTGGFSVEILLRDVFKIYLSHLNDGTITLEIENFNDDSFIEVETKNNSIDYLLRNIYYYFVRQEISSLV